MQSCRKKLWTSEAAVKKLSAAVSTKCNDAPRGLEGDYTPGPEGKILSLQQQQLTDCLSECIRAAEGTVKSLADVCSKPNQSHEEILFQSWVKEWLERLAACSAGERSLDGPSLHWEAPTKDKHAHSDPESSKPERQQNVRGAGDLTPESHKNLLMLLQIYTERAQKMSKLEEAVSGRGQSGGGGDGTWKWNSGEEHPNRKFAEGLKEKQRACRKLEEKLAIASLSSLCMAQTRRNSLIS